MLELGGLGAELALRELVDVRMLVPRRHNKFQRLRVGRELDRGDSIIWRIGDGELICLLLEAVAPHLDRLTGRRHCSDNTHQRRNGSQSGW